MKLLVVVTPPSIYQDCLTDNIIERLKFCLVTILFNNLMYESNPQNADIDDLPFGGDELLITIQQLYRISDHVVERLGVGLIVEVFTNLI